MRHCLASLVGEEACRWEEEEVCKPVGVVAAVADCQMVRFLGHGFAVEGVVVAGGWFQEVEGKTFHCRKIPSPKSCVVHDRIGEEGWGSYLKDFWYVPVSRNHRRLAIVLSVGVVLPHQSEKCYPCYNEL